MCAQYTSQANQQDIKSKEKSHMWEAKSKLLKKSHLLWNRNSITMFTKAHYTLYPQ